MTKRVELLMPDLSPTTREVTLVRWLAEVGEEVALGQPLLEVETEKAVMDVEAVAGGVLRAVHFGPGDVVGVGQLIAVIGDEAAAELAVAPEPAAVAAVAESVAVAVVPEPVAVAPAAANGRAGRVSLFARNRAARERGAASLRGTALQALTADRGPADSVLWLAGGPLAARQLQLAASARAERVHDRMARVPVAAAVACAALRALAAEPGAFGDGSGGVAVCGAGGDQAIRLVGPEGAVSPEQAAGLLAAGASGDGARPALLLVAIEEPAVTAVQAGAGGVPVLGFGLPQVTVSGTASGRITVGRRLALSLTIDGAGIEPGRVARWLGRLVAELEGM